jgi:hypothetical protein
MKMSQNKRTDASLLKIFLVIIFLFNILIASSQEYFHDFKWEKPVEYSIGTYHTQKLSNFEGANYDFGISKLPFLFKTIDLSIGNNYGNVNIVVLEERYEAVPFDEINLIGKDIPNSPEIIANVAMERKRAKAIVKIVPFRNVNGVAERLVSIRYRINVSGGAKTATGIQSYAETKNLQILT